MSDGEASAAGGASDRDEEDGDDEGVDAESHLADVEDGAGCTEIWEHLSERREADGT